VEAFYAAPSHERPRDSEGWERLGLYEYFKTKNLARKQKEDDIREGKREKSKSPSPIRRDTSPSGRSNSPPRRRYQRYTLHIT
jgi:calcium homeostasis ER protein